MLGVTQVLLINQVLFPYKLLILKSGQMSQNSIAQLLGSKMHLFVPHSHTLSTDASGKKILGATKKTLCDGWTISRATA